MTLPPPRKTTLNDSKAALLLWSLIALFPCSESLAQPSPANEARWEKEIAAFEQADRAHPPATNATVFIGSSSIRQWKTLADDFPDIRVLNRGFGGSHIADATRYAERVLIPYRPRCIVLYAGDNDIAAGLAPQQVRDDFTAFAQKVHAALPQTTIVFISIKPSLARWPLVERMREANRLMAAACARDERLIFVDVFHRMLGADGKPRPELFVKDGLHLSPAGYAVWAAELRPVLQHLDARGR